MQHDELQCGVYALHYDFNLKRGMLGMDAGDCCDMTACVALFQRIDPAVETIFTYSGGIPDTVYRQRDGEWMAHLPLPEPKAGALE